MQSHAGMDSVAVRSLILANAQSSLRAIDGVQAIFLSGSLAQGTDDRYSDIDLRVVVADAAFETVVARREYLPTTWGPFLFFETMGPNLTVAYYESLTKADVFYYASSAMRPSPWFNIGTRILLDRTGNLAAIVEASKSLKFVAPAGSALIHLEKCLAGLIEGAKRMRRGELIYASRLCTEAVNHLLLTDDLLSERAPFGSAKRESLVPGELTELAQVATQSPTMEASGAYFSRLAASLRLLVSNAEHSGHCSAAVASRLLSAIDQMILLAGGS